MNEKRKNELESLIESNRTAYEAGEPCVDDLVYDAWVDELKEAFPNSQAIAGVGRTPVTSWTKAAHDGFLMGSLEKVNTPEEMKQWLTNPARAYARKFVTSEKLDGISIHLVYEHGALTKAITRGDGSIGEDILQNVLMMEGVQKKIPVESADVVHIRGEIVLKKSKARNFPEATSLRNTAAGTAKRYDGTGCQHLSVMCYDTSHDMDQESKFLWLERNKFATPSWSTRDPVEMWCEFSAKRDDTDYDADGLVVTACDCEGAGITDGRPKWMVAFKYAPQAKETKILSIEWNVGSQGRVTPVANFEPITLAGAQITNASLYNAKYIRDLGIGVGASVIVTRAGDVIPRVDRVTQRSNVVEQPPDSCPKCGMPLWRDGEYIVCKNSTMCDAQISSRILRWLEGIGVMDAGEKLVQQLVENGTVRDQSDLYTLTKQQLMKLERMGEKSADNFIAELAAHSELTLQQFFGSLCIPNVGQSTIAAWEESGLNTFEALVEANVQTLSAVKGVGKKKAESFAIWYDTVGKRIVSRLLKHVRIVQSNVQQCNSAASKGSVCFTGAMSMTREEIEKFAKSHGFDVKNVVTKGLTYLVVADKNSTSSKTKAAAKYGTKILTEDEFNQVALKNS